MTDNILTAEEQLIWRKSKTAFLRNYNPAPHQEGGQRATTGALGEEVVYQALCDIVETTCKELLKPLGILHQTSSRAKKYDSLEGKVTKFLSGLFPDNPKADEAFISAKLEDEIKDRAGARILLYFPDDVGEVVEAISNCPDITIEGNKIAITKSRRYRPNDSRADYADGAFLTELVGREQIKGQRWKHYGYRAAHLIVKLSDGGQIQLESFASGHLLTPEIVKVQAMCDFELKTTLSKFFIDYIDSKKPIGTNNPIDTTESVDTKKPEDDPDFREFFKQVIGSKKTEIQLTTVIMHAWSQVEHDIVYKTLPGVLPTERMDRMLDGINGLSITSEILLQELREANRESTGKAEAFVRKEFENEDELDHWLKSTYHTHKDKWEWKDAPQYSNLLWMTMCRRTGVNHWQPPTTAQELKAFIKAQRLLEHMTRRPGEKLDISLLLLKAMVPPECSPLARDSYRSVFNRQHQSVLYNLFMVANSFSIMASIVEKDVVKMLGNQFSGGVAKMRQIENILTCTLHQAQPVNWDELDIFAKNYLTADWCEIHELAITLTRLNFVISHDCDSTDLPTAWYESGEELCSDKWQHPDGSHGPLQAVTFCCPPQRRYWKPHRIPIQKAEKADADPLHRLTQCFNAHYGRRPERRVDANSRWHRDPRETSFRHEPGNDEHVKVAFRIHVSYPNHDDPNRTGSHK
jgi:ppGpp synthetase/RelA/SpoT-type nucleotidyltranferase